MYRLFKISYFEIIFKSLKYIFIFFSEKKRFLVVLLYNEIYLWVIIVTTTKYKHYTLVGLVFVLLFVVLKSIKQSQHSAAWNTATHNYYFLFFKCSYEFMILFVMEENNYTHLLSLSGLVVWGWAGILHSPNVGPHLK